VNELTKNVEKVVNEYKDKIKLPVLPNNLQNISSVINGLFNPGSNEKSPIMVNEQIRNIANRLTGRIYDFEVKGYSLFDWFEHNMTYEKGIGDGKYKSSERTFWDRTGNCAEMAFLYIAMARSVNMESYFTTVKVDCFNKNVQHACASIQGSGKKIILVDPAYHVFDVKHKESEIYDDIGLKKLQLRIE
jgi:hypothetical protein